MTDKSLKTAVLEQARVLASEFVTEFRSEVNRLLLIENVPTVSISSAVVQPSSVPAEEPVKKPWAVPQRVVDSFIKERDTTAGLKGLKLQYVEKDEAKVQLPSLINTNFTTQSVEKMIASFEEKLKDPSFSPEQLAVFERTRNTLRDCIFSLNENSPDYYAKIAQLAKLQEAERNMHERSAMIKTVYDSDLEDEIQSQAKVLLAMTEAVEKQEAESRNPLLEVILANTQPIDAREKEAGISSEMD